MMSFDPVMRVIAAHWDSVEGHLTPDAARRFRALVERFTAVEATADDRLDAAEELLDMLAAALPATHPVRRAIADPASSRSARTIASAEEQALIEELRRLLEPQLDAMFGRQAPRPEAGAESSGPPQPPLPPDEIARYATGRLLAAPTLTAEDLRRRGGDPGQEHLIRLDSDDGARFPLFQFDASGRPLRLVLDINALLDADADPWGVADWWLGRNSWLSRTPAESIGRVADEVLLTAARTIVEANC